MRQFAIISLALTLTVSTAFAGWEVLDDFDTRLWQLEPWPMTENSTMDTDDSRSVSGQSSLRATLNSIGWGGGITIRENPAEPAPSQGMSVSIFCEAEVGATDVAPIAKLEVYRPGGGESMGSADTPLRLNGWTTIDLPASTVDEPFSGCGIIFLQGDSAGPFTVWVDAIMKDGEVWEDFEAPTGGCRWAAANIDGSYAAGVEGASISGVPALDGGNAMGIHWWEDNSGVELKTVFDPPRSFSVAPRVRVRAGVREGAAVPRMSIFLWDGESGDMVHGDPLTPGEWSEQVFDFGNANVNLSNIVDLAIVFHEYQGTEGHLYVDRIEVEGN